MEGFVVLQVQIRPAMTPKPLLRLAKVTDTFRDVLESAIRDLTGIAEATKTNYLQGTLSVELSSSRDPDSGQCSSRDRGSIALRKWLCHAGYASRSRCGLSVQ
jgi:hypothetical protein